MDTLTRTAATETLLDAARRHEAESWLIPAGQAALPTGIASDHPGSTVWWQPIDVRERGSLDNAPANLRIDEPGRSTRNVWAALIAAPPDRDLARRWLLMARDALEPGGRLFLAGANREGIRPVIGDATKLFGMPIREDFRVRGRLAVLTRGDADHDEPVWAREPGVAPGSWQAFDLEAGELSLPLVTQAGVFAGGKVDAGTRLLLDTLPGDLPDHILDVGCGTGVIGLAAALRGAGAVDLTDVNLLAIQAAAENIRRLGLPQCRAFPGDVYAGCGEDRYDLIVSNPPFHRGKAIDYAVADRLIEGAPAHLRQGGSLLIVANAFLAFGKRMERVFAQVVTVSATRQFHVLRASGPR